jgi:hypothetical protein
MAGTKNRDNKFASYLTEFAVYRSGINVADSALAFEQITLIELSPSISAHDNQIRVLPVRTAGAGNLTIELWRKCASGSYNEWMKVSAPIVCSPELGVTEVVFASLRAAQYRVKASVVENPGVPGVWTLHECHTEE